MDNLSRAQRSARMRRIRHKDTRPELIVRRLVHAMGYRYRLHASDIPGNPDIAFRSRRKVIFVHGCFWHQHPEPSCSLARMPKSRQEFWGPKLTGNRARDADIERRLIASGWSVLTIWECELRRTDELRVRVREFLGDR